MSSNPAFRRGALQAFHHEINYAFRKLRGNAPTVAAALRPHTQQLQKALMEVGGHTLPSPSAHWPPWQSSKKKQLPAKSGADHIAGVVPEIVAPSVSKPRVLAQHSTEETAVPTEDGPHSCSDTASWQGSFEEERRKRHSRKPRSGRRAKSRLHNGSFEDCVRSGRALAGRMQV